MWDLLIINPMVNTLLFIYSVLWHNFGLAIIIFTILIRLITHPLTIQQLKGASAMQELQKTHRFNFGISSTIFSKNLEDADNILAWAKKEKSSDAPASGARAT